MGNRLQGKVAIITGAGQGMGLETTKLFLDEGAKVVGTDINFDVLKEAFDELGTDAALPVRQDVTSEADWDEVVKAAVDKYGKVDVLVNNAGIHIGTSILDQTLDQWNKELDINATSVFLGTKAVKDVMIENGGGSIVNISSAAGIIGGPRNGGDCGYTAAKGAVRLLTKHCAQFLSPFGIRTNSVHPGRVLTAMAASVTDGNDEAIQNYKRCAPLPPYYAEPIDVAHVTLFFASDEARYINGAEMYVDGGMLAY